ncbi:MAG: MurR/RpiR family transcriptional regulator [Eisenbergiella massiliensis]
METTLIQIQNMYSSFGRERKLADWLLQHPSELIGLSISELAAACGCGDATVIRFSKKLGLSGYQALKVNIARELGGSFIGNTATTESDSALELYQKHCSDIMLTLERTRNRLSGNTLEAVADALLKARTISVFGLGSSASIALDATHKLVRLGLSACAYSDSHMQMIIASHLTAEDVVLAFHSGSSWISLTHWLKLKRTVLPPFASRVMLNPLPENTAIIVCSPMRRKPNTVSLP